MLNRTIISRYLLLIIGMLLCAGESLQAEDDARTLTTAKALRELTPDQVLQKLPVKISGVVTGMRGPIYPEFFIQDETGGVIAHLDHPVGNTVQAGQHVMVEGVTHPQQPTPRVRVEKITVGDMVGMPAAQKVTAADLRDGHYDCAFVEFTGVIRVATLEEAIEPPRLLLDFGSSSQRLGVWVSYFDEALRQKLTVDTTVTVRGICLTWKSPSLQPFSTFIVVSDPRQIDIIEPAPADPWIKDKQEIKSLRNITGSDELERRHRVQGVVTLNWPDKAMVIQDQTAAVHVLPPANSAFNLGDVLDASGFILRRDGALTLEDAAMNRVDVQSLPVAEIISARQLLADIPKVDFDFKPVRLNAEVKEVSHYEDAQWLTLQDAGVNFRALLPRDVKLPTDVRPGSHVEMIGICRPTYSEKVKRLGRSPDGFELWLQDARSIILSDSKSWWTTEKISVAIVMATALILGTAIWGTRARVRMKKRTQQMLQAIRERNEAELLSNERMRLAADLHDTLSQSMAGAAMQLDVASAMAQSKPESAVQHLKLARKLLDRGRQDLRRTVWDLQPTALVHQSLVVALQDLALEISESTGSKVEVHCTTEAAEIPERLRAHLYRIAQEAAGNTSKYADASKIILSVSKETDGSLSLLIQDNGKGFDLTSVPGPEDGHFGLTSMQERAKRLGGTCEISSGPTGTVVKILLPAKAINAAAEIDS